MSFFELFFSADWVIKSVLLVLIGLSLWSWSVIFGKLLALRSLNREADEAIDNFSENALERSEMNRFGEERAFGYLISLSSQEWQRFQSSVPSSLLLKENKPFFIQRMEQLFSVHIDERCEDLNRRMPILNLAGSTSFFIGLLGTIWGIMNSFQAIAETQNTSLAVVAPGIAEALFTTAIGLFVAIPASIAYNRLNVSIQSYRIRMENFAQIILATFLRPSGSNSSFSQMSNGEFLRNDQMR